VNQLQLHFPLLFLFRFCLPAHMWPPLIRHSTGF
jgi:hypothetical protein